MKPFTEQEMIKVAKAAGYETDNATYDIDGDLAWIVTNTDECIEYCAKDGDFSLYDMAEEYHPSYNIQAVADTIREILKERGDDNTSN